MDVSVGIRADTEASVCDSPLDDLLDALLHSVNGCRSVDHAHDTDDRPEGGEEVEPLLAHLLTGRCGLAWQGDREDQVTQGTGLAPLRQTGGQEHQDDGTRGEETAAAGPHGLHD